MCHSLAAFGRCTYSLQAMEPSLPEAPARLMLGTSTTRAEAPDCTVPLALPARQGKDSCKLVLPQSFQRPGEISNLHKPPHTSGSVIPFPCGNCNGIYLIASSFGPCPRPRLSTGGLWEPSTEFSPCTQSCKEFCRGSEKGSF